MEFRIFPESDKQCLDCAGAGGLGFRALIFCLFASTFAHPFCDRFCMFFGGFGGRGGHPLLLFNKAHSESSLYHCARSAPGLLLTAERVLSENPRPDSGKHAFSVIEGAVKSRAIKGEGFGERGRGRVRDVGIYRRLGLHFFVFLLGSFSSCSFCSFFFVFCALLELKMEQNLVKNQFF